MFAKRETRATGRLHGCEESYAVQEQELILTQELARLAIWEWHVETDELKWLPGSVPLFGRPMSEIINREDAPKGPL